MLTFSICYELQLAYTHFSFRGIINGKLSLTLVLSHNYKYKYLYCIFTEYTAMLYCLLFWQHHRYSFHPLCGIPTCNAQAHIISLREMIRIHMQILLHPVHVVYSNFMHFLNLIKCCTHTVPIYILECTGPHTLVVTIIQLFNCLIHVLINVQALPYIDTIVHRMGHVVVMCIHVTCMHNHTACIGTVNRLPQSACEWKPVSHIRDRSIIFMTSAVYSKAKTNSACRLYRENLNNELKQQNKQTAYKQ